MSDSKGKNNAIDSPILVRQSARLIEGIHTEVVAQAFSDRILIVVTQTGKMGSLTQITMPLASIEHGFEVSSGSEDGVVPPLPVPPTSLQLTSLLSSTPSDLRPLFDTYLSQIAMLFFSRFTSNSSQGCLKTLEQNQKPVVVGLALLPPSNFNNQDETFRERFRFSEIMKMVLECKVW
ncbi:hypothetical protein O181_091130 [Austropuccinia psidii MF-1]|uniref:Proteasome assembly chaperone 3 n=1 Tax=Austropuccinia psidii MF-1 TaxID=1389203 RepID=A0A9Q3IW92_9BASI|nr:hypothetical protein [Austropuccinia psidii MF-1]